MQAKVSPLISSLSFATFLFLHLQLHFKGQLNEKILLNLFVAVIISMWKVKKISEIGQGATILWLLKVGYLGFCV